MTKSAREKTGDNAQVTDVNQNEHDSIDVHGIFTNRR